MAKHIVTESTVHEAADSLQSAGVTPTTITVQERTGGSFTTVQRHLKTWQEARARDAAAAPDTPAALNAKAAAFIRALWVEATTIARDDVRHTQEQAAQEVARIQAELSEAKQVIERLEALDATQAQQLDEQSAALRKSEQELMQATVLGRQVPELQRALDAVHTELDTARQEALRRAVEFGKLQGETEALRMQVRELTAALGTSGQRKPK